MKAAKDSGQQQRSDFVDELKNFCSGTMPRFQVPSFFVLMQSDTWPLNAARKVDLARLPKPTLPSAPLLEHADASITLALAEPTLAVLEAVLELTG